MRIVLVLVLLTSVAFAGGQRVAIAPKRTTCKPNGAVWLQVDVTDSRPKSLQSTTKLYGNGATTITRRRGKIVETTNERCVPPREMEYIQKLLKDSPWKATKNPVKCEESSPQTTVVRVYGKKVFTDNGCSPDTLDEKSAQAWAELKAKLPRVEVQGCQDNPLAKGCI